MLTTKIFKWRFLSSAILLFAVPTFAFEEVIESFPLNQIRITHGQMAHAQQTNVRYLLAMEPDRLLAPYLREAGIGSKAEPYGNWENTGLDGHIGGHYLSALSLAWTATGQPELKRRLDYMIERLAAAQIKAGGYLGGIPNGLTAWQEIRQGTIKADLFSLNDRWVPLYNIDKIYHGLRDAYLIGKNQQAREMLIKLTDWMLDLVAGLTDEQIQLMLYSEHGGLNEVFVDVATITGEEKYLELGRRFSHLKIINPLLNEQDELTGLHANTQIPKIIGMLRYAEATKNMDWINGAEYFWQTVTGNRTVSIGGNSVREHFHSSEDFTPMIEDIEGPETCNTYNMMKLSLMLFKSTSEPKYLDYYERATYNHILSSQHPEHGGLVYFTSMRPGHYRMYSAVEDSMWCCVGSGIENHSKYGEFIYAKQGEKLLVNMFVPSTLDWQEQGIKITQRTQFPDSNQVSLKVNVEVAKNFTLNIRQPNWIDAPLAVKLNGKLITSQFNNGYVAIDQTWQDGDTLTFELVTKLYAEQLPDGQDYYSLLYGPVVLANKVDALQNEKLSFVAGNSRMGHIAAGPTCPPEALPIMLASPDDFIAGISRIPGSLAFRVDKHIATVENANEAMVTTLIPFYSLHDSRYQVYWPQLDKQKFDAYAKKVKKQALQVAELAAKTIDKFTPGQQQPEVEHEFKGDNTRAGVNNGHHWRDAFGWFSYKLSNKDLNAELLRIKYFKHDINRRFVIEVNGELLAKVDLKPRSSQDDFYYIDYPLTQTMKEAKTLELKFYAKPESIAGGIYGIRLMSHP